MDDFSPEHEAEIFGRYLLGLSPNNTVKKLYAHAIQSTNPICAVADRKLLTFALKNNWSIGLIDSGLAFLEPGSELRRRLYILFAIMESTPEYADHFLTRKRNPVYLIIVLLSGIRAVIKTTFGSLLIKIIA
ncbi:MAG: hypothetical protein HYU69_13680 [Bacteroidetes bacterium]|nr:hypothetical protein [Bacteroidota bacterium]